MNFNKHNVLGKTFFWKITSICLDNIIQICLVTCSGILIRIIFWSNISNLFSIYYRISCICQDWDKKNFIFFCTYSIKSLLIFKVQNSLLLLTFSLLPIEEASSFFTTGFLYYSFCLLHCISDKVLTLKHNLYIFVVVNEHLINYVGKYISVILFQHTILG